jgi:hypothetical protein
MSRDPTRPSCSADDFASSLRLGLIRLTDRVGAVKSALTGGVAAACESLWSLATATVFVVAGGVGA